MQLEQPKFNSSAVKKLLIAENKFLNELISSLPIPQSKLQAIQPEIEENGDSKSETQDDKSAPIDGKSRAQSLTELQGRLQKLAKKKLNYKDKLLKKGLKNRIKKKSKKEELSAQKKLIRIEKLNGTEIKGETEETEKAPKPAKPVFNSEGKMVFSKFDFSGLGPKNKKKGEKDPKKILKILEKQKEKLAELEAEGEKEKAAEIKEKHAWKNALAKAEGQKIKDDPILLKKSIKKRDQLRKHSQKKWAARKEGVEKAQEIKQNKRNENLAKRKKDKKVKNIKKAVKKGKIVPGF